MLSSKNTVPLPESGTIIRRTGKYSYVYKVLDTFRNAKGQPTNTRRLIGRLTPDGGRLVPNDGYFELYPDVGMECPPTSDGVVSVVSAGPHFLSGHVLARLGRCGHWSGATTGTGTDSPR